MGIPLLVRSPVLTGALRPFWVSLRTPKMPTSHPLRASLAPPLHWVCTSNENENGGHILEENGDLGQSE